MQRPADAMFSPKMQSQIKLLRIEPTVASGDPAIRRPGDLDE
jgi:hypothetical protein